MSKVTEPSPDNIITPVTLRNYPCTPVTNPQAIAWILWWSTGEEERFFKKTKAAARKAAKAKGIHKRADVALFVDGFVVAAIEALKREKTVHYQELRDLQNRTEELEEQQEPTK